MSRSDDYIFVLWGDKFDEVAATTFVVELRKAGFLVKVVGLTPPNIKGEYGLALVPDLTLDQALQKAANTICIIIPYQAYQVRHLRNDPRVSELLQRAHSNNARFVVRQWDNNAKSNINLLQAHIGSEVKSGISKERRQSKVKVSRLCIHSKIKAY